MNETRQEVREMEHRCEEFAGWVPVVPRCVVCGRTPQEAAVAGSASFGAMSPERREEFCQEMTARRQEFARMVAEGEVAVWSEEEAEEMEREFGPEFAEESRQFAAA